MDFQPSSTDIAWAAGLFEGEGCWNVYVRKSGKLQVQARLTMTDADVVGRFARIVGMGHLRKRHSASDQAKGWKPSTDWYIYEADRVRELIRLFMPYLGIRRRHDAERVLDQSATIRTANIKRTRCPAGHELVGANLILEPFIAKNGTSYFARRCRECRTNQTRSRARHRLGILPENYRIKEIVA